MKATTEIKRPALRYYGGKWLLAPWIISHFPTHKNYVEPCGGAASVLLRKPRSPLETYNDLDGNLVNFFRVLRDKPDELVRKIRLTPWARAEYELSFEPCNNDVEAARRIFVAYTMSISGATGPGARGWGARSDIRTGGSRCYDIVNNTLEDIAKRLAGVQIEHKNALDIIDRFDNDAALIYFDPPYVDEERTKNGWYAIDWNGMDLHIEAASILRQSAGYIVVSGYACPLYDELYENYGWQRVDKESQTNSGGKRIESLWLSPRTWEALQKPRQMSLFNGSSAQYNNPFAPDPKSGVPPEDQEQSN